MVAGINGGVEVFDSEPLDYKSLLGENRVLEMPPRELSAQDEVPPTTSNKNHVY